MIVAKNAKGYFFRSWKARLGALLLHRSARKQHGFFDRVCNFVLGRLCKSTVTQPDHFMRDELIDEEVEFDPAELNSLLRRDASGETVGN